ncbi:MAG: hypothetical protein K6G12_11255 [Lachnospiraceae bacterium]|nr:hypothetical protein [Lachnospiraceae bacterium]
MASQINNYQCPACTGPLHYVGTSDKLECDYCGSSYSISEIEKLYAEQEEKAKEEYAAAQAVGDGWDNSNLTSWGEEANGMKVYSCPSCGAELITDETTAASCCPYCGNNNVVPGQFEDTLKPDKIIPFKITKEQAMEGLKNHYKGKKLLPKSFVSGNSIQEITGVYVPFWLFDGSASADVSYRCEKTRSERHGDDEVIITDHFDVQRSGHVEFDNVPVDASSKMPSQHMDSIEPFDYSDLRDFSTAYLPGFLADKYDISIEDSASRADVRFENTILSDIAQTVTGYSSVQAINKNVRIKRGKVEYALFPVWMLSTKFNGETYTFAMNGQTGKMVGDLPIDKGRLIGYFFKWFIPVAAVVALLQMLLM